MLDHLRLHCIVLGASVGKDFLAELSGVEPGPAVFAAEVGLDVRLGLLEAESGLSLALGGLVLALFSTGRHIIKLALFAIINNDYKLKNARPITTNFWGDDEVNGGTLGIPNCSIPFLDQITGTLAWAGVLNAAV